MKLYRFMSEKELNLYLQGETIKGKNFHTKRTTSSGICFLGEKTVVPAFWSEDYGCELDELIFSPIECLEFLYGIVSDEILACFETKEIVRESEGIYARPYAGFFETFVAREYCIDSYCSDTFQLVDYVKDPGKYSYCNKEVKWEVIRRKT